MNTDKVAALRSSERASFLAIFGDRTLTLPVAEQPQATYIASEQRRAWEEILRTLEETIGASNSALHQAIDFLKQTAMALAAGASTAQHAEHVTIQAVMPIIQPADVEKQRNFIRKDSWFCFAATLFEMTLAANASGSTLLQQSINYPGFFDPRLAVSLHEVAEVRSSIRSQAVAAIAELDAQRNHIEEATSRAISLEDDHRIAFSKREDDWSSLVAEGERQIEALKSQVTESIRLAANRNLWSSRTAYHQRWTLISFGAMTIGVLATVSLIAHVALPALEPSLIDIITRRSYLTPKLILIVLCVIGVGWVLRFVARSIADNMTLRADAAHRQSMLDTYLALRGEGLMTDADRSVILNALFRPLPGQSNEELNPPMPALEALKQFFGKTPP